MTPIITIHDFKSTMRKTRLFIASKPLNTGLLVKITDNDFEYLAKVMRKKIGDEIFVFNGINGEWKAEIIAIEKKNLTLKIVENIFEQMPQSLVTLAFAPVKNVRIDFVAAKATEMGVGKFLPIITKHSVVDKINEERFAANIKEACEQCERNDLPQILPIKKLEKLLAEEQNGEKILILCDESHQGTKACEILPKLARANKEIIILIGPEGGFSQEEFVKMRAIKNLHSMSLGKRILRSDTAIIAALALVNEFAN